VKNMTDEKCPVCGGFPSQYSIDDANLDFLRACAKQGNINEVISLSRIAWASFPEIGRNINSQFLIEGISSNMLKALEAQVNEALKPAVLLAEKFPELVYKLPLELDKNLDTRIEVIKDMLVKEFKGTMNNMGFPEPEQMKLLSNMVPVVVALLQQLLMLQKIPGEKGKAGELELLNELKDCFPEDDYEHVGGSGDTDIIATPKYGDIHLNQRILIESKKNDSGWDRDFLEGVRKHMQARSNQFAILAVEVMPKGAKGFLVEHFHEGVIFVTSRRDIHIAYAALRSAFIATYPLKINVADLRRLLEEKKIEDVVKDAMHYQEYLRKIRVRVTKIVSNAKKITEDSDELDVQLKMCLNELQRRIREAVKEIDEIKPALNAEIKSQDKPALLPKKMKRASR